jgi:hypothetical protein
MSDLYMQLLNILLVILFLIIATKFHTGEIDKTKLENKNKLLTTDNNLLKTDNKQLQERVQTAKRREKECVEKNDACEEQIKKFEELKKTNKQTDDKIDHLEDQLHRQIMKKNHFESLLNTTQKVCLADQLRILRLKKKHDLRDRLRRLKLKKKYFQSLSNTTQQVKDEVQPVECAVKTNHHQQVQDEVQPNNLDYAQTFIYVVETCIFCLLCVIMYVQWNLYKTQTAESDDLTEEEILQFGNSLPVSSISKDGDGRLVVDQGVMDSNARVLREILKILRKDFTGKKLLCRPKRPKKQEETCWAAIKASIWNQVQFDDIESNMTSTANFCANPHDYAESKFNRNPVNKHGRFLDEYRAIPE